VFAAPALGRLITGRVRPLISLGHPAPSQVPRLACTAPPQLVPAAWVLSFGQDTAALVSRGSRGCLVDRSQQKISNRPARDATRAPDAETHEHVTVLVDTGHHALRAFGTKRPWVQIPPPRRSEMPGQRLAPLSFSGPGSARTDRCEVQQRTSAMEARGRLSASRVASEEVDSRPSTWTTRLRFRRALARYLSGRNLVLAFSNRGVDNCNTPA
jgi:hypothetical protein